MLKIIRLAVVPVAVLALAACSGSSGSSPSTSSVTPAAAPTGSPGSGAGGRGGFGGFDFQAAQACLKAAGISVPTPSGGFPTARPSGVPSGQRPTNFPRPSGTGRFRNGNGGLRGVFQSKQAQAALKACGITLPTGGPRPTASAGT